MKRKAVIISLSGTKLTKIEKELIRKQKPWGIILFKRNIASFNQIKKLTQNIRSTIKDDKYPILIDEEGGDVTRLTSLIQNRYSQKFFGDLYRKDRKLTFILYEKYLLSIIEILKKIKININTVPVLDLLSKKSHNIIKNRCYSDKIKIVNHMGNFCLNIYKKNKISTVIKHIPGHGGARSDSHKSLPIINKNLNNLIKKDFRCFKNKNSFFAMTAHILYKKLDKKNCVTHSKKIINEIIRKKIGFRGLLISDDISMKALKFDIITNAKKSLKAGCNLVLYCSGNSKVSTKLLKNIPLIDKFTQKKTSQFYKFLG